MRTVAALAFLSIANFALAQDISNPQRLMFVADVKDPIIDVIDLAAEEVVYRISTEMPVDHLIVTPYAPILIYASTSRRTVTFYNLRSKEIANTIRLPFTPRHLVLDTTGRRVGVSDSRNGGFALLSAYNFSVDFMLDDFPATADVLFDPNDVDIYFSDNAAGSIGILDMNTQRVFSMPVLDHPGDSLSSPSRSLDGRYVYVANRTSGEVFGLNAYSKAVYKTFRNGNSPARPYTTPEGLFLYLMDETSGRFSVFDQQRFEPWAEFELDGGANLVAVGRFDRLNLLLSSQHRRYSIFDNIRRSIVASGELRGTPIGAQGSADGEAAYVGFADRAEVAVVEIESQQIRYISATTNGASSFVVGLTNNVCH